MTAAALGRDAGVGVERGGVGGPRLVLRRLPVPQAEGEHRAVVGAAGQIGELARPPARSRLLGFRLGSRRRRGGVRRTRRVGDAGHGPGRGRSRCARVESRHLGIHVRARRPDTAARTAAPSAAGRMRRSDITSLQDGGTSPRSCRDLWSTRPEVNRSTARPRELRIRCAVDASPTRASHAREESE